jgi:dTMP kinase
MKEERSIGTLPPAVIGSMIPGLFPCQRGINFYSLMAITGLFITFEGSEGCGKSTQIGRLADKLRSLGREVVTLREPGGTPIGEKIRNLLQYDDAASAMTPEAELLLFAASRAQLVNEVIRPALERGAIVLCDRFLDSTTVYQGVARSLPPDDVTAINAFAVGGTFPDLTLLLDLDAAEGRRRASLRKGPVDRMEGEREEFYEAVRRGYTNLAQANPSRFVIIDASPDEQTVEDSIATVIFNRLKEGI